MKTVLLDADLILQGLTDDGDFHHHFVALWQTLQSSTLQGYITKFDLARLHRQLAHEIGLEASERLLMAFERILKIWAGDSSNGGVTSYHCYFDAIITENPQSFYGWDVPTLSVTEFLQRYELDSLLKQTSEPVIPLTNVPNLPDDHKATNKLGTAVLLMLPILLELWIHRAHLNGVLTVIAKKVNEEPEASVKAGLAPHSSPETINVVEHALANSTRSPSALLLFSDLPGLGITVEDDVALDVQLDSQGNAVIIRLQIPQGEAQTGNVTAATLYQGNNHQAIAQIVMTEAGLAVIAHPSVVNPNTANPSQAVSYAPSGISATDGQLIATVQYTADSGLTARLNAHSSLRSDRNETAETANANTVVSVRSVNQYSSLPLSSVQRDLEIRVDISPDGNHSVTVNSPTGLVSPTDNSVPGINGGGRGAPPSQPPGNSQPNPREIYGGEWVLNNNGSWMPGNPPSPEGPPESDQDAGAETDYPTGRMPGRPYGMAVDPSITVMQIAATDMGYVDMLYAVSLPEPDGLLGGVQHETMWHDTDWIDVDQAIVIDSLSTSVTASRSITISVRHLSEIEPSSDPQTYSTGSIGGLGNTIYLPFPNDSATPSYEGLPTSAVTGV
ncbi:hypothetical protein H6G89_04395 [Oscillatoria sp. FACHB-1407]|uniref:hypothetical protein n=1 Tax=Oscillatoria sp. FACHB-1407 TaxID=2692847 RepID=UPI001682903D|nr:hypothetical protein [Oscillatoria sp. FACHB-1407]MBD2460277.1 hypothetical protein [Oscillatoria sp. FACHB-1407]